METSYGKNVNIERLCLNDNVDQETGNSHEAYL
jgi:hypothetical protein